MEENTQKTEGSVAWEFKIPLLTNPHIMFDFVKLWTITGVVVIALMTFMGFVVGDWDVETYVAFIKMILLTIVGLSILMILVMLLWFKNRFYAMFSVDAEGAAYSVGQKQSRVNTAVAILGALAGNPGVAGAGLLAKSQESGFFPWNSVFKVIYFPGSRVITLKNTWRTTLRIYCTAENYEEVRSIVQAGFEAAATSRNQALTDGARSRSQTFRRVFSIWTLLALFGAFVALANPIVDMDIYGWWMVLVGLLVLLSGVFAGCVGRIMAIAGLVGSIWIAIGTYIAGSVRTEIIPGVLMSTRFSLKADGRDSTYLYLSIVGIILLLICSIKNIVRSGEQQKVS